MVVVNLLGLEVREAVGCNEGETRRVLRVIAAHRDVLMEDGRRFHG